VQGDGYRLASCISKREGKVIAWNKSHFDDRDQNNPFFEAVAVAEGEVLPAEFLIPTMLLSSARIFPSVFPSCNLSLGSWYFPGSGEITVKVLAERGSGRLLGGQIVGMEGSAKRIDTLATALHAGFTVEEMINLDLGYAPPFSPVWDPVVIAAREALKMR
jgi:hypothetical protein